MFFQGKHVRIQESTPFSHADSRISLFSVCFAGTTTQQKYCPEMARALFRFLSGCAQGDGTQETKKEKSQNAFFSRRKPQIFADSPFSWKLKHLECAENPADFRRNRRFSQKTTGNHGLGSVTLGASALARPHSLSKCAPTGCHQQVQGVARNEGASAKLRTQPAATVTARSLHRATLPKGHHRTKNAMNSRSLASKSLPRPSYAPKNSPAPKISLRAPPTPSPLPCRSPRDPSKKVTHGPEPPQNQSPRGPPEPPHGEGPLGDLFWIDPF